MFIINIATAREIKEIKILNRRVIKECYRVVHGLELDIVYLNWKYVSRMMLCNIGKCMMVIRVCLFKYYLTNR